MKKILILLLLLLPLANAQDITISLAKNNYHQHETLQAEVSFNLSLTDEITASNFALIDKNNNTTPTTVFLEEITKDHYFIYFNIPKLDNGTYYFLVKDIIYTDNILKKTSKSKEFSLDNLTSISIFPAILNHVNSTTLKINNYGNPINITIKSEEINLSKTVFLENTVNIDLEIPVNEDEFNIRIDYLDTFYLIPVIPYNIVKETKPLIITKENIILLNSSFGTYFNKNFVLEKDSAPKGPFYIKNTLNYAVDGLTFYLTGDLADIVRLDYMIVGEIEPRETLTQYVWINENKNPSKLDYRGSIELRLNDDLISAIPMEINFLDEKPLNNLTEERLGNLTKPVKNITSSDQVKEEEEKNNLTLLFIILIPLALIALLYFIFKKDKKKGPEDFFKP